MQVRSRLAHHFHLCFTRRMKTAGGAGLALRGVARRPLSPWGHRRYAWAGPFQTLQLRALFVIVICSVRAAGYTGLASNGSPRRRIAIGRGIEAPAFFDHRKPWVIDGDTVDVRRARSPRGDRRNGDERGTCTDGKGQPWPCGMRSGKSCAPISAIGSSAARRKAMIVTGGCSRSVSIGGVDVNAWMRQGWALAYGYSGDLPVAAGRGARCQTRYLGRHLAAPQQWRQSHR